MMIHTNVSMQAKDCGAHVYLIGRPIFLFLELPSSSYTVVVGSNSVSRIGSSHLAADCCPRD